MGAFQMSSPPKRNDYFTERLEEQIDWHSDRASDNKRKFYVLQTIIIVTGASISVVNAISISQNILYYVSFLSSILGGIVVIFTALIQMYKFQENWILYRTTGELLKKEKFWFLNDVGPYSELNPEQKKKLLVERVETMVSSETSKYFTVHKPEKINA